MKLYTKKGDDGTTGLIGNVRVPKNAARVAAYGTVDETNAAIGVALASDPGSSIAEPLRRIQADLFIVGAELATPAGQSTDYRMTAADVARLETWIDETDRLVPPLSHFVLPGGSPAAAALHFARGLCRRAEREVVTLADIETVGAHVIPYLNRLADLLFAMARLANQEAGVADVPWKPSAS